MTELSISDLIASAEAVLGTFELRKPSFTAGSVAAALQAGSGKIYTGVCIDVACGVGFCAEHSAIAEMLKHREVQIRSIVAINSGGILAPCGRCRELMAQVSEANADTAVVLSTNRVALLRDLLPEYWL